MVKLKNISKRYGDKRVLDDVNMIFGEGITCIMGPSGRGKTTLAYIIAGLVPADAGSVETDGERFAVMFQEDRLLDWESAAGNVLFVNNDCEKAQTLLTEAGLADSIHLKASELSGGMKRRVCLCRTLIADYEVIILDEPFKGLDSGVKPKIMDMVKKHSQGKIVICITHDEEEAKYLGGGIITI